MSTSSPIAKVAVSRNASRVGLSVLFGLFVGFQSLFAQDEPVLPTTPAPEDQLLPLVDPGSAVAAQTRVAGNQVLAAGPTPSTTDAPPPPSPFQYGELVLHPHLLYRFLYGGGIQAAPGQSSKTTINTLSAGLLADIGTHFTFDYTPTWNVYSNSAFRDTVDHSVDIEGHTIFEDWVFKLSQTYTFSSDPLVETGQQTDEEVYTTAFDLSYAFGPELRWETQLNQNIRSSSPFIDSKEWTATEWLHLQVLPRLDSGLGAGIGYEKVSSGPDMLYFEYLAQVQWRPGNKLSLLVQGGLENRKFLSSAQGNLSAPVISASLIYKPVKQTTLSLTAERTMTASYFADQIVQQTRLAATLEQQLVGRLRFSVDAGLEDDSYHTTTAGVSIRRSDNDYFFNLRLTTTLLRRGTVAIIFDHTANSSNSSGFGFSSNQMGLELGYSY